MTKAKRYDTVVLLEPIGAFQKGEQGADRGASKGAFYLHQPRSKRNPCCSAFFRWDRGDGES
jgi:hypothetical protein